MHILLPGAAIEESITPRIGIKMLLRLEVLSRVGELSLVKRVMLLTDEK